MFFVLSGFLITTLLLEERDRTGGRMGLWPFYQRRARRLLPALIVMVAAVVTVRALAGAGGDALRDAGAVLLYYGNWASIGDRLWPMQHTWSLAIEEQFYIVWPLVLIVALRIGGRRMVTIVALTGAAASVCARVVLATHGADTARLYLGTDTRADALLIGCALAASMRTTRQCNSGALAAALVGIVALGMVRNPAQVYVLAPLAVALLSAVAVASAAQNGPPRWLALRPLTLLGQRSYAVYLWHEPVYFAVRELGPPHWLVPLATAVITAALTGLSWRYVEEPFLRRRSVGRSTGAPTGHPTRRRLTLPT